MNKRLKPVTIAAAAVVFVMLAGCTSVEEKAGEVARKTVESLEQTVNSQVDNLKETKESLKLSTSAPSESASAMSLENDVGDIELEPVTGNEITVEVTIWAQKRSTKEEELKKVTEQATVSIKPDGNKVKIYTHAKDDPDKDLWEWADKNLGYSDFSIDYRIGLPEAISAIDIHNNVGSVIISGLKGSYQVESDVGSIEIKDAGFNGESRIAASTGSINLEVSQMESEANVYVKADIGSIVAKLADSLDLDLETKADLGDISGAAKGTSQRGSGGPLLSLETSVGSITVK